MKYRDWTISRVSPPIPTSIKWQYVHKDYDGPGDRRCSVACSLQECIAEINEHDGIPYSSESLHANAELLLLTERLEKLEEQRVKDLEQVEWLNAKAWIEFFGITDEDIWLTEEVHEITGRIATRGSFESWANTMPKDSRNFVQVDGYIYTMDSVRSGVFEETGVTIEHVRQFANFLATKPDTNPA